MISCCSYTSVFKRDKKRQLRRCYKLAIPLDRNLKKTQKWIPYTMPSNTLPIEKLRPARYHKTNFILNTNDHPWWNAVKYGIAVDMFFYVTCIGVISSAYLFVISVKHLTFYCSRSKSVITRSTQSFFFFYEKMSWKNVISVLWSGTHISCQSLVGDSVWSCLVSTPCWISGEK